VRNRLPGETVPSRVIQGPARRRGYRYHRRHTPHFYIVVAALSAAAGVGALHAIAYRTQSILLADVAFAAVLVAALIVFLAYFWGFYMLMSGHIPKRRLKLLISHAGVGTLSPLLYTLNICLALDGLGSQPVSLWMLCVSMLCFALLAVQFAMGRALVHPESLRLLRGNKHAPPIARPVRET
jgi:uncharacterized membrane protein